MEITARQVRQVQVVEITGEINSNTAPDAQSGILAHAGPGVKMLVDMSRVSAMSSAGLRLLLIVYRTITGKGGKVHLVGLSEDLRNTMTMTGFLDFFSHHDDLDAGLAALA
jgi:anti-sigma B factor antagonist